MTRLAWGAVLLLAALGVFAAVMRAVYVSDWATRAEPIREATFGRFALTDPNLATRRAVIARLDAGYGRHRVAMLLHVVPGAVFLAFAPLQFSRKIRTRYLDVHRWLGRALMIVALVAALSGLFFGLLMPFAGTAERVPIGAAGFLLLLSVVRGFISIRRGDSVSHRRWMIRAFAVALGVSTVRIVHGVLDLILSPRGVDMDVLFILSLWLGWIVTLGLAEWWIRRQPLTPPAMIPAM